MSRRSLAALLCALALGGALLPDVAGAQTEVPRLKYRQRTLDNGLKVYSIEDHSSPTVAIHVWYRVGSKDDPEGRSGFAHLFEHMMFKRTRSMPDEMLDRLTEDVGGYNNAYTADDVTVYHEVVPSNYLQTLLWAEAERLSSLQVHQANFASERDVVKEEFRQNYLARPYGKLWLLYEPHSFQVHPYRRPGIGNIEQLDAATLPDVQSFHATYYRPDNATLVVAGDFEPAKLDEWVDRYFAPIPKPDRPLPRVDVQEPPRTAELRVVEHDTNVPLPAVLLTFLLPPVASDDTYALRVAQSILSEGNSSRLYRSLVYEQQLAQTAEAWLSLREDASLLVVLLIVASDKSVEQAESALLAELERVRTEPVSDAELDKAKNKLLTQELRERETNDGKASALGEAAVLLGEPERVNTNVERLGRVSAQDVQRVLHRTLAPENRLVLHYLPQPEQGTQPAAGSAQPEAAPAATPQPQAQPEAGATPASEGSR